MPVVYHMKIQVLHSGSTVIVTVTAPLKGGLLPVTITGAITGQNGGRCVIDVAVLLAQNGSGVL